MKQKKIIQIEVLDTEDFMSQIADLVTLRLTEECGICEEERKNNSGEWMTTKEACKYYKVSVPTLKRMRERGEVVYSKVGRNFRYLVEQ